ncbi:hypothetical protein J1N35_043744 [Gossypium stocksii]|uniref:Uncharacterized protein n=1 Tax=Gossypium stocksii TaxID=47602 RepID=A0A9D3U852_9ROSI|nr:hypothetical protein J1N35_043744 [Gossypium stocksii]
MTDSLEVDRKFVIIRVLLFKVYVYKERDNRRTIYRMRDLKSSIQEEAVINGELKDFVTQNATSSGQSLQGKDKGKQKVRGFEVKRILVDSGNAVEVLTWAAS